MSRFITFSLGTIVGGAVFLAGYTTGPFIFGNTKPTISTVPEVATADATDLINRLLPLSECSRHSYCSAYDLGVTVSPNGVTLRLKQKDRSYDVTAPTLRGAVDSIANPSPDLRKALEGWKP